MKYLSGICLVVMFALMVVRTDCRADDAGPGQLYARGACLLDGDSGRVLYGKEETQEMAMASTTKIMTCILVLEQCDITEEVTASANAAGQPKVHLGVKKGQRFLLEDLLFALMLESYNDAAVMLAEHVDGSTEAFARRMNEKAALLGCEQTHFVTPNGLDAADDAGTHHTTAADLARIMQYCVKKSPKAAEFLRITGTKQVIFSDLDKTSTYTCSSHNRLADMTDGVISGKTGFTNDAGYCYVGAVEAEGRTFILSLLGCGWPGNKTWKWQDAKKLLAYGKERYHLKRLKPLGYQAEIEAEHAVWDWKDGQRHTGFTAAEQQGNMPTVLVAEDEKIRAVYICRTRVSAPVKKGTVLGSVQYMVEEFPVQTNRIELAEDIPEATKNWCARFLLEMFLGFESLKPTENGASD